MAAVDASAAAASSSGTATATAASSTSTGPSTITTIAAPTLALQRVVFTGWDNNTTEEALLPLAIEFPAVEFGVLIARGEFGDPKYPTEERLVRLLDYRDRVLAAGEVKHFDISCHICNDFAKELVEGSDAVFKAHGPLLARFARVQLNFARFLTLAKPDLLFPILAARGGQEFVFQIPSFEVGMPFVAAARAAGVNAFPFFDPSAGMGISPKGGWPTPPSSPWLVGFAGGLGPHNLEANLTTITALPMLAPSTTTTTTTTSESKSSEGKAAAVDFGLRQYWVDMETNVRSAGVFDLAKVRQCLLIADPFLPPAARRISPSSSSSSSSSTPATTPLVASTSTGPAST